MKTVVRKPVYVVIVLVVIMLSFIVSGCSDTAKVDSINELLRPQKTETDLAKKWVELYGSELQSTEHYNIAMARIQIQQLAQIVGSQGAYISDVNDPNSLAAKVGRMAAGIEVVTALAERVDHLERQNEMLGHGTVAKTVAKVKEIDFKSNIDPNDPNNFFWTVTIEQDSDYLGKRWDFEINAANESEAFDIAIERIKSEYTYFINISLDRVQAIKTKGVPRSDETIWSAESKR